MLKGSLPLGRKVGEASTYQKNKILKENASQNSNFWTFIQDLDIKVQKTGLNTEGVLPLLNN